MRALRKIIFVNSANIRYAEVKLDGNVHFIGTQGVGKSLCLGQFCSSTMLTNYILAYQRR